MTYRQRMSVAAVIAVVALAAAAAAGNNPVDENWWPSEFGADDQAGATNTIDPAKRLAAVGLVKRGVVQTLGMPYSNAMPLVRGRTFALSIPGYPTHGPLAWPGQNFSQTFMDEMLTAEIGQAGTQLDGLAHVMIQITGVEGWADDHYFYNGVRLSEVISPRGLKKMGTENVGSFFTRGILIDIAALKGVDRLDLAYPITMDDYRAALAAQGIEDATRGDVVLFRTGWNHWWKDNHLGTKSAEQLAADSAAFNSGAPGISAEVCDYLAARKVALVGADSWAVEVVDRAKPAEAYRYCHMNLIVRHGIYLFENLDLDGLSADRAYEFLFSWAPIKLVGATGAPGNPIAAY